MNYFRNIIFATVLAFACMPLMAMEAGNPRSSFFGRCYNYAAAWVSSSFFVTKDFVKREFNEIRNRFAGFTTQTDEAFSGLNKLERTLDAVQDSQHVHRETFARVTQSNQAQLANAEMKLKIHNTEQEILSMRLHDNISRAQERERTIKAAHATVAAARQAVEKQRKEIAEQDTALHNEHEQNKAIIRTHYTAQNGRLDSALALLEANKRALVGFDSELSKALADSRKRLDEQKMNGERLVKLEKQATEYQIKSHGLRTAWVEFKKKQVRTHNPVMISEFPYVPFGTSINLELASQQNSAAASASSSSSNIYVEEID